MAEIIRMPRMSDTMEEGVIVEWFKKVGDNVEPGDVLAEVETDKATMELESYHEGVLLHIGVNSGPVPVNGILAVIGEEGEDYSSELAAAQSESPSSNGTSEKIETTVPETVEPNKVADFSLSSETKSPVISSGNRDSRIKVSPLAKSMAVEAGVDVASIPGSGDQGRIIKRDVEAFLKAEPVTVSKVAAKSDEGLQFKAFSDSIAGKPDKELIVSQMRKTIARRLGESKFVAPHFYLTIEVDMAKAIEARKSINEVSPVRISFNDMILKACAFSLEQHPAINSSWLGDKIRVNGNINIGVAVAVEDGLLVPVVNHANLKTFSQINTEVKALAVKARNKKLQPDEMQGNTFTVSNLGMFGIEEFTAIINPPDSCILAVGGIFDKAVVVDGTLAVGKRMKMTLSCDHRVVDGATGAKFLQTLQSILQDPVRLLI